jgi:uncharacterized membrane protein YfcA
MIEIILLSSSFVTSFISGIFGMAGGVILMGVLLMTLPVAGAMILHGYLQFISNANRTVQIYNYIYWTSMSSYVLGVALSIIFFLMVQIVLPKHLVYLVLGCLPIFGFLPRKWALDFSKKSHAFVCGFSTSGLQFLSGVNGPLLDVFFVNTSLTRHQIIATKAVTQSLSHVVKVVYFLYVGQSLESLWQLPLWFYLLCIPTSIYGTYLGIKILNRLSDKSFLQYTKWILAAVGCMYLYKSYVEYSIL